ncbi:MAG: hypothetical protein H0W19_00855 [Nitrosopumilus sp.]|nr:hypothetical protein [Nitrosopumilus sp.]
MNFIKYAAGMFVFAGIISLLAGSGVNYFAQSINAQSLGEQIGNSIGGVLDETGEAAGNATESLSGAANETGEASGNATEGASQAANDTASEFGQAADNATTSGNSTNATESKNPLDMLMNLFKGN